MSNRLLWLFFNLSGYKKNNIMKKVIGRINLEIRCDCPYCGELQYTDNDKFRKEFTDRNDIYLHHDQFEDMDDIEVKCQDCEKEFIIEKVEYGY